MQNDFTQKDSKISHLDLIPCLQHTIIKYSFYIGMLNAHHKVLFNM